MILGELWLGLCYLFIIMSIYSKNHYVETPTKSYYILSVFFQDRYLQKGPPGIGV